MPTEQGVNSTSLDHTSRGAEAAQPLMAAAPNMSAMMKCLTPMVIVSQAYSPASPADQPIKNRLAHEQPIAQRQHDDARNDLRRRREAHALPEHRGAAQREDRPED